MKKLFLVKSVAGMLLILTGLFSCSTTKNIKYFSDLSDSTKLFEKAGVPYSEPVIQPDDILSVSIQTIDPTSTAAVNQAAPQPNPSGISASGASSITGYLVDKNGEIDIPLLGKIKVGGLTTFQARDFIQKQASVYYKTPSVQVRYLNFKITVIGEVAHPATYTMPNEKVTLLDAIGQAGDLTIYGKRDNILLVRENDGKKTFVRFNLNSSNIFNSPYYYMKQNDVLYIEPNDAKIATTDAAKTRMITIGASILSAMLIVLIRVL